MDKKLLTFEAAWMEFYAELERNLKPDGHQSGRIPNEIKQAHYAMLGKSTDNLGFRRAQRLFDKYAPGKYSIITAVEIKEDVP